MKYVLTALAIVLAFAAGAKFATVRNELAARKAAITEQRVQLDAAFGARAEIFADAVEHAPPKLSALRDEVTADYAALAAANTPAAKAQANDRFTALRERMAQIPAFEDASDDLAAADDRIADEREKYNDTLEHYNAVIQTFPVNLVAAVSGYSRFDEYFKTGPEDNFPGPAARKAKTGRAKSRR